MDLPLLLAKTLFQEFGEQMTKYEVQYSLGNPKLCRVTGLKLRVMPEYEGGGWATDERTAKIIAEAMNAAEGPNAHFDFGGVDD